MAGQCGTMMGGRRRKGGKKTRKMKGGVFVGFGNNHIAPGAADWVGVSGSKPVNPVTLQDAGDPYGTTGGTSSVLMGGKRRKSRKGGKSRKPKKGSKKSRKMKGGAWNAGAVNVSGAGYGFAGATPGVTAGIAPPTAYQSRVGGAPMGGDGVRSA